MGTLVIKSSSLQRTAEYTDTTSGLKIDLDYRINEQSTTLMSINGSIYKTDGNVYAGNFSGYIQNDTMEYSMSGVKLADMANVTAAIIDIESQINGQEE